MDCSFWFQNKTYRFVVNARTGKVHGERPWSIVKIALAVVVGGALTLSAVGYLAESSHTRTGYSVFDRLDRAFDGTTRRGFDWASEPAPSRWPRF